MCLTVLVLAALKSTMAQPYYFSHYQVEQGLSNNSVICSIQDRNGFLWFGTKDGLNRFDGYTFKVYRYDSDNPQSIGNNSIRSFHEDNEGLLWVGTENGIYIYNVKTENFKSFNQQITEEIRSIKEDSKGNVWIISGSVLYKYNRKTNKLKSFSTSDYFEATTLCIDKDNTVWVGTAGGTIERYNETAAIFTSYSVFAKNPRVSTWIEKIYDTGKGVLMIGTSSQGVKTFHLQTLTYKDVLTHNSDKTEIFVRDFIRHTDDEFWIATESGIFVYNLTTRKSANLKKQYNDPYSISDNAVYTFCKDKEGGIWAGTFFGGLNYYSKQYTTFEKFFPMMGQNSLSGNAVREICPDKFGNLWIGTEDGGLNKLNVKTNHFTSFKPTASKAGISNNNIHGLLAVNDTLWIGTFEHGLDIMDIKTGRILRHYSAGPGNSLKSNFVLFVYRTKKGDILVGTARGLYKYRYKTKDFTIIKEVPDYIFYASIYEDTDGTIWLGTYRDGIYFFNPRNRISGSYQHTPGSASSLINNRINGIFEDSNGSMWFATEGGLCKLLPDGKNFKRYTTKNGFPSDVMYSILEDNAKHIWVTTSKGLADFNLSSETIKVYTKANGILNNQFNYNSAYKDATGQLYFGSVKGLIRFNPARFSPNSFVPPVYITGFQVDHNELVIQKSGSPLHHSITYTDTIVLKYNQSTFSIDFAALSYTSPGMTEYAYKMTGLDTSWTYLKTNRKVYFTKLSPGNYIFTVKASSNNNVWNENGVNLYIKIRPPFWASTPAYITYLMIAIMVIFLLMRYYHNYTAEKNRRMLEYLESEKIKEIYKAKIEFFTNVAHEIRTPLTLIKGPMEKVIKKVDDMPLIKKNLIMMERNTNRLLDLTNQLLDFRKTESNDFSLNFVKADICELLKDNFLRFQSAASQKKLCYKIDLPSKHLYAYIDTEAFNKILSNLLNNAIKYSQSKVYVNLLAHRKSDQMFIIQIKNDGHLISYDLRDSIFKTFFRIAETEKQPGTGIGLSLSRSLTELHTGSLILTRPEDDLNVFELSLPIHQKIEFNLSTWKKLEKS